MVYKLNLFIKRKEHGVVHKYISVYKKDIITITVVYKTNLIN